jgi:hypothetical protein
VAPLSDAVMQHSSAPLILSCAEMVRTPDVHMAKQFRDIWNMTFMRDREKSLFTL